MSSIGQDLASVPISDMITALGIGIAQAQFELDKTSADVARMMSGINPKDRVLFGGKSLSLIELGFTPTFYQFIESTIEIKVIVKMSRTSSQDISSKTTSTTTEVQSTFAWWRPRARIQARTQTVDARISNNYDYSIEGSSLVRTKLVPVPPPPILEERIRALMEEEAEARYQEELELARKDIRKKMVQAIKDWQIPSEPLIQSLNDLQSYFLDNTAHASYKKKVLEFPEIVLDTSINSEFKKVFNTYVASLKTEIEAEIDKWLLSEEEVFDSLRTTRDFFFGQQPVRLDARVTELSHLLKAGKIKREFDKHYNYGNIFQFLSFWELTDKQKASLNTASEIETAFFKAVEDAPNLDHTNIKSTIKNTQTFKDRIDEIRSTTRTYNYQAILNFLLKDWVNKLTDGQKITLTTKDEIEEAFFQAVEANENMDDTGIKTDLINDPKYDEGIEAVQANIQAYNLEKALSFAEDWEPSDEEKRNITEKEELIDAFFTAAEAETAKFNLSGIKSDIENADRFDDRMDALVDDIKDFHVEAIAAFFESWELTEEQKSTLTTKDAIEEAFFQEVEETPDLHLTGNKGRVRDNNTFKNRMDVLKNQLTS